MTRTTINKLTWATPEQRKAALDVINGKKSPMLYSSVQVWVARCFTMPSTAELQLRALGEILETYGEEELWLDGNETAPVATYLNTGSSYELTVIYRYDLGRFMVCAWGDLVEMWNRQGKTIE